MSTINIYRLFDPLDIQQLQPDIERSACATPTGGFMPGFTVCNVYDNGFWTLENTLTEGGSIAPKYKTIEEAVEGVAVFMRDFDIAIGGGKPTRAANSFQNSFDWNTMQPNNRPPQFRDGYTTPKAKNSNKPKFFENIQYVTGSSDFDGYGNITYSLVYGISVSLPQGGTVMVRRVIVTIRVWRSGIIKQVKYNSLPIKKADTDKYIAPAQSSLAEKPELFYRFIDEMNLFLPFYE